MASTTDFQSFERHGIIFCPENKDVILFPEKSTASTSPSIARIPMLTSLSRKSGSPARPTYSIGAGMSDCWAARRLGDRESRRRHAADSYCPRLAVALPWAHCPAARIPARGDIGEYAAATLLQSLDDPRRSSACRRDRSCAEADFESAAICRTSSFPPRCYVAAKMWTSTMAPRTR